MAFKLEGIKQDLPRYHLGSMGTPIEHIDQSEDNLHFLSRMITDLESERRGHNWEVVILFYSALHVVEALLAMRRDDLHPSTHKELDRQMRKHLRRLLGTYDQLFNYSHQARYIPKDISPVRFGEEDVKDVYGLLRKLVKDSRCTYAKRPSYQTALQRLGSLLNYTDN